MWALKCHFVLKALWFVSFDNIIVTDSCNGAAKLNCTYLEKIKVPALNESNKRNLRKDPWNLCQHRVLLPPVVWMWQRFMTILMLVVAISLTSYAVILWFQIYIPDLTGSIVTHHLFLFIFFLFFISHLLYER